MEEFKRKQWDSAENARKINKKIKKCEEIYTDMITDGYHTFGELYEFRKIYNVLLFNEWYKNNTIEVYKSKRHYDNKLCFNGGWFIVVAMLPTGQITNHYELKDWDLFNIKEYKKVKDKYDGHTPQDTVVRITKYIEYKL